MWGMAESDEAIQFDLLTGLAEQESSMCVDELAQVDEFVALTKEHKGLILNAVVPELLQVSRQRWHDLRKEYGFESWEMFDKTWYSRKQLERFAKLNRSKGGGRPSLRKIWDEAKTDLLQ